MSSRPLEPIAVVGLGLRFPGADSPNAFWENLRQGGTFVGPAAAQSDPSDLAPRIHAPVARLDRVDGFDWRAFGIPPQSSSTP
jgi:myxalamid-type polyketide synthase MxaB